MNKLAENGDTIFTKLYGDSSTYYINHTIIRDNNSNLILGNYFADTYQINLYHNIIKIDTMGNFVWGKKIIPDTNLYYYSTQLIKTRDDGFLFTGSTENKAQTDANINITKVDSLGNFVWEKNFGGANYDVGRASIELPDHGFFVIGQTRSFGAGQRDWLLIRTDSVGNKKWQKTFGSALMDTPLQITKTLDTNYLIAGVMEINGLDRATIMKIDTAGNTLWVNKFQLEGEAEFWKATQIEDSSIIAAGSLEFDTINYISQGLVLKCDKDGNELWHRVFPVGNDHAWFRNVYPTADGGFIMPGSAVDGPSGNQDAWLVKVDSLGCDSNGCALYTALPPSGTATVNNTELQVYPNPCGNFFVPKFTKPNYEEDTYTVTVINNAGQQVLVQKMINSHQPHPVFVTNLPAGFYTVQVSLGNEMYYCKLVKG